MKNRIKSMIAVIVLSLHLNAQKNANSTVGPKNGILTPHAPTNQTNTNSEDKWLASNGGWNSNGNSYGSITIGFGNYPYGNPNPYYGNYNGYYGNYYSVKKAAKKSIHLAGVIINDAVNYNSWHDIYSPMLAKAIRHYNYSKQLYFWGNYNAALNHAERAHYLAWYSLQYFQNPNCYNNGINGAYQQPDPYSDPNNPYYKQSNPDSYNNTDVGQKQLPTQNEKIDGSLPNSKQNDREIIRTFDKSALIDE